MISWQAGVEVITLFVDDLQSSKFFYESKFGLTVEYEDDNSVVLDCGNLSINLRSHGAEHQSFHASALVEPTRGPRLQITIDVDDVDKACADLSSRGVSLLSEPTNRVGGFRNASFIDPDGHVWEVAEQLPQAGITPYGRGDAGSPERVSALPVPHPLAAAS